MRENPGPRYLSALETPAAVVDLDRLAFNLDRMAAYAALHGLALRPHVKTHKAPRIAAEQMRLGAVGLTCATPRELEVMSGVARDLLLAYPPVGPGPLSRLLGLPRDIRVAVALDSSRALAELGAAARAADRDVGVLVEVDMGMHRVGVQSAASAVALARETAKYAPLHYAGIAFYPGHIRVPVAEQDALLGQLQSDLRDLLVALDRAGMPPPVVSGGSTPAGWRMHEIAGLTEVRPGTYVFNDRTTVELGACEWEDCALTVLATVVSTAVPGQAVIDAGSKALGREPVRGIAGEGFGALADRPQVLVRSMSEEHGVLDLSNTTWRPEVGERVQVVPNHVCIVVHLNDIVYGVRNGEVVETEWEVAARGRLR